MDPLSRTSGIKSWLRQHVLSISLLSYSFSHIKKDRRMPWYLSEVRSAQDLFNTRYLPVLLISAIQANSFNKFYPYSAHLAKEVFLL